MTSAMAMPRRHRQVTAMRQPLRTFNNARPAGPSLARIGAPSTPILSWLAYIKTAANTVPNSQRDVLRRTRGLKAASSSKKSETLTSVPERSGKSSRKIPAARTAQADGTVAANNTAIQLGESVAAYCAVGATAESAGAPEFNLLKLRDSPEVRSRPAVRVPYRHRRRERIACRALPIHRFPWCLPNPPRQTTQESDHRP